MTMTPEEWLNALAILESIDEVPGMPTSSTFTSGERSRMFALNPIRYLRRADDATRAAIWAEVERRLGGNLATKMTYAEWQVARRELLAQKPTKPTWPCSCGAKEMCDGTDCGSHYALVEG